MSHIVQFTITGLAGNPSVCQHKLDRHVNVFYGLNGAGKTSLLRILHSAMAIDSQLLENVPFKTAVVSIFSNDFKCVLTYATEREAPPEPTQTQTDTGRPPSSRGTSDTQSEDSDLVATYEDIRYPTGGTAPRRSLSDWKLIEPDVSPKLKENSTWERRYLPTSRLYLDSPSYRGMESAPPSEDDLDRHYASALQTLWKNYGYDIVSAINVAQQEGLADILRAVLSDVAPASKKQRSIDIDTAYQRMTAFVKRQKSPKLLGSRKKFAQRYELDPQLRNVVADIDRTEQKIAAIEAPRSLFQELIRRMFTGNKEVVIGDESIGVQTSEKHDIGVSALSSGEKHILRICIEMLKAKRSSIFIDEPELSLHVDWQRELISDLRGLNPEAQLVLATHSPDIMADVPDDMIFRL